MTNPQTVCNYIVPQYRRIVGLIHSFWKPFIWHSRVCIFEIMDKVIALGIDAKHSNEDDIDAFSRWIENYSDPIALLGGFDVDFICHKKQEEIFEEVVRLGSEYRARARGYALDSGNSIPAYVPVENFLAMIRGAQ